MRTQQGDEGLRGKLRRRGRGGLEGASAQVSANLVVKICGGACGLWCGGKWCSGNYGLCSYLNFVSMKTIRNGRIGIHVVHYFNRSWARQ